MHCLRIQRVCRASSRRGGAPRVLGVRALSFPRRAGQRSSAEPGQRSPRSTAPLLRARWTGTATGGARAAPKHRGPGRSEGRSKTILPGQGSGPGRVGRSRVHVSEGLEVLRVGVLCLVHCAYLLRGGVFYAVPTRIQRLLVSRGSMQ